MNDGQGELRSALLRLATAAQNIPPVFHFGPADNDGAELRELLDAARAFRVVRAVVKYDGETLTATIEQLERLPAEAPRR